MCWIMNVAKIHDKCVIMHFWEQKIEHHGRMAEDEEVRMKNSALSRLRKDWASRLEKRTKHLQNLHEEGITRTKLT
ncbi:protein FAM240A [Arapaima gigas]